MLFVFATVPTGRVRAAGAEQSEPPEDGRRHTVLLIATVFVHTLSQ